MERHFTATAFLLDSKNRTLLLWHLRLGRWMPPGGHVDPHETPEDTARRECKEETDLDVEIIGEEQTDLFMGHDDEGLMLKKPVALLLENIPASKERREAMHQHMDFVYLARPLDERQAINLDQKEGSQIKWFTREEIEKLNSKEIFINVKQYILRIMDREKPKSVSSV